MNYFDPVNPQLGDVIFHGNKDGTRVFDIRHPEAVRDNVGVVCDVTGPEHGPLLQYGIKVQMLDGRVLKSASREWRSFRDLEYFLKDYTKETHDLQEKLEVMAERVRHPQEEIDVEAADLDM
jgi:hypothetical protein